MIGTRSGLIRSRSQIGSRSGFFWVEFWLVWFGVVWVGSGWFVFGLGEFVGWFWFGLVLGWFGLVFLSVIGTRSGQIGSRSR